MKLITFGLTLSLVISLVRVSPALAQEPREPTKGSWEAVKALPTGAKLIVRTKDKKKVEGHLSGVDEARLTLTRKNQPVVIQRQDISSVRWLKKSKLVPTLIGGGAGFAIDAAIGSTQSTETDEPLGVPGVVGGLIGLGVGALVGWSIGAWRGEKLIYEDRQQQTTDGPPKSKRP